MALKLSTRKILKRAAFRRRLNPKGKKGESPYKPGRAQSRLLLALNLRQQQRQLGRREFRKREAGRVFGR